LPANRLVHASALIAVFVASAGNAVCVAAQVAPPLQSGQSPKLPSPPEAGHAARKPPITASGFVDDGPVVFEDVTKRAGLSGWTHTMGAADKKLIIDTNG